MTIIDEIMAIIFLEQMKKEWKNLANSLNLCTFAADLTKIV